MPLIRNDNIIKISLKVTNKTLTADHLNLQQYAGKYIYIAKLRGIYVLSELKSTMYTFITCWSSNDDCLLLIQIYNYRLSWNIDQHKFSFRKTTAGMLA